MPASLPQNIADTKIEELLPSIERLTAEVRLDFLVHADDLNTNN
jgi:hypothetical protein